MRKEDVQCFRCHNECLTTMVISDEGLVTEAWRNIPARNCLEKGRCKTLADIIGKNFRNACNLIKNRAGSTRIRIGH